MRIHGLDAVRIIAEFFVVMFHYSTNSPHSHATSIFAYDLMSLFYFLSGLVCSLKYVHNTENDLFHTTAECICFWKKKITYAYPIYFILCFIQLISFVVTNSDVCPIWRRGCFAADFFSVSGWFLCPRLEMDITGVGWYIGILFNLWVLFPMLFRCVVRPLFQDSTWIWTKVFSIYVVLNLISVGAMQIRVDLSFFPLCRMFDFMMGAGVAFTLDRPISRFVVLGSVLALASFYLTVHFYLQWQTWACTPWRLWDDSKCMDVNPFQPSSWEPDTTVPCITFLRYFWGKSLIFYAPIVQFIASKNLLEHDIFKMINPYSLMLYLSHIQVMCAIRSLTAAVRLDGLFMLPMYMIAAYVVAYYLKHAYDCGFRLVGKMLSKRQATERGEIAVAENDECIVNT